VRHSANTVEDMKKLLLGYRDNMRVEIESGVAVTAKTVADLRALTTWPEGLVLDIHARPPIAHRQGGAGLINGSSDWLIKPHFPH
jgi:hypothetical protein